MFHNSNLTEYAGIINQAVDGLINNLRAAAKTGERLDMHRQLGRLTMQVIGAAAFGVKFDTQFDASDCLIENTKKKYYGDSKEPALWKWFKSDPNNPYKDSVPAESSIISKVLEANNKATGTHFTHLQIASQTNLMMLAG